MNAAAPAAPREADRAGTMRKLKKRRRRRLRLGGCLTLLVLMLLAPLALYGVVLFASGTEGGRQWVEGLLSRRLDAPVTVDAFRVTRSLDLAFEGVSLTGGGLETSGARIDRARLHFSPTASRRKRAMVYDRIDIRGVTLDVMETRAGTREPVALTRLAGLDFWGDRRLEGVPALARLQAHANGAVESETVRETSSNTLQRKWVQLSPQHMEISMTGVNIRILDTQGVSQCEFSDLEVGVDPGLETVATPATRYSVRGSYQMRRRSMQPLHLEILHQQGEWHFIHIEADQRFLRWLGDVLSGESAGPLVAEGADGG